MSISGSHDRESPKAPMIARKDVNFAGTWQSRGEFYVSAENICDLDAQLKDFGSEESEAEKAFLHKELSLTYFARFHNLIREEYQFEKRMIEERLRSWGRRRLQQEGYTLFDMRAKSRGSLFQDSIVRFHQSASQPLPFHRFAVGDSVRVSLSRGGDPSRDDRIEGVVLERRSRYIDVALRSTAATLLARGELYRLDNFVNRCDSPCHVYASYTILPMSYCLILY